MSSSNKAINCAFILIKKFGILKIVLVLVLGLWSSNLILGQEITIDSSDQKVTIDTSIKSKAKPILSFFNFKKDYPNPKKAALLSLIPGGGQIYNKKHAWIKLPVIYGGMFGMGYWAAYQKDQYNIFNDAYLAELNGEEHQFSGRASAATLKSNRDISDKNYQSTLLGMGALYLAGILEAYVTSHLLDFDVDDDISLQPKLFYDASLFNPTVQIGVGYKLY